MAANAYLWDTCVIYRWFNSASADYVDHIHKYLEEADRKSCEIFISTITLAEIAPSKMGKSGLAPAQVLSSMSKSFVLFDTSPGIMSLAGHLRDQRYRHVDGPEDKAASRSLSLGDSIHLATAVALQDEFGVQNLKLHTFDEGKNATVKQGRRPSQSLDFTIGVEIAAMTKMFKR